MNNRVLIVIGGLVLLMICVCGASVFGGAALLGRFTSSDAEPRNTRAPRAASTATRAPSVATSAPSRAWPASFELQGSAIESFQLAKWSVTKNVGASNTTTNKTQDEAMEAIHKVYDGARWSFEANGRFVFTPKGLGTTIRDDVYPVRGSYTRSDGKIKFTAKNEVGSTVAGIRVTIEGSLSLNADGSAQATIMHESWSHTATSTVGGQQGQTHQVIGQFVQRLRP